MIDMIQEIGKQTDQERQILAATVGHFLLQEPDEDDRRQAIENLARLLAQDACEAVRMALSVELKDCSLLPGDLAKRIARDVDDVSLPFIEASPALTDDFLAELVEECSEAARAAVAGRPGLSEPLAYLISDIGGEQSVSRLMINEDAAVSKRVCFKICDRFDDEPIVLERMAERSDLTLIVIDKLIDKISTQVAEKLVQGYGLAEDYGHYIEGMTRRRAVESMFRGASEPEMQAYLARLHRQGQLGPEMLLHFLEIGEVGLFRVSISVRANVPEDNVVTLLEEGGSLGLERLMEKCGIGEAMSRLIRLSYYECIGNARRSVTSQAVRH